MSVLATTTRADDFADSLAGKSSLGVEGCATPVASLIAFDPRLPGGCCGARAGVASPPAWSGGFGAAIGVPSGRNDTVRTGLGLGNSEVIGGGSGAAVGGTSGVLTVAATGVAFKAPADVLPWSAAAGGLAAA